MKDRIYRYFEGLVDPYPEDILGTPPVGLSAFCWHYCKPIWPWLLIIGVSSVLIALLEITVFSYIGTVVDWLSNSDPETFMHTEKPKLLWMLFVVVLAIPLSTVLWSLILHQGVFGNFPMRIRWQAHCYMLDQSMQFYQDEFAGRVATKVMQTALSVRETVIKILDVFVYISVYFIGGLVLVISLNPTMFTPFAVWFAAYLLVLRYFLPKMAQVSQRQADARSLMAGRIVDSYTNIATVKLFAHAGREIDYAKQSMRQFMDTVHPQMRLSTEMEVTLTAINNGLLVGVGGVAIWQWLDGSASVASVAVAAALVTRFNGMAHWILWETSALFENIGMTIDGMKTIARSRAVQDAADARKLVVEQGAVRFENVRFNYEKQGGVIDDLTLNLDAGQKVGLVGRSGAGKTTLMNILLRLYDIDGGRVTIDGQNINAVTQASLRAQIAVVTQDTSLLHRSVRDNIAYGRPDATEAQIIAAATKARAHDFILDLKDHEGNQGYDAQVGERGVKLSGGQRQRIAIARVFLKDAPILVLDEATSALDSEVESVIQEQLFNLMEGKTVLAIAHRLSTIANLDQLIVLDKGAIIERGNHDQLLAKNGLYASLWNRQTNGFIVD